MAGLTVWQLLVLLVIVWPALHVIFSSRSHGGAKFGWLLAVILFPLLAYIVFLIVTQRPKEAARVQI